MRALRLIITAVPRPRGGAGNEEKDFCRAQTIHTERLVLAGWLLPRLLVEGS